MDAAAKEDRIIFNGLTGTPGLLNAEGAGSLTLTKWDKVGVAADQIIAAVTKLDSTGFHGPYSLALAPAQYNLLLRRYPQGDGTELEHISSIVGDGVVKAPALKKGGVLIASGSQYASIAIGQDLAVGYNGPVGDLLEFQIYESLALVVRAPESILVLK
jgi:uncharacterized linocin/CFP29 family protein